MPHLLRCTYDNKAEELLTTNRQSSTDNNKSAIPRDTKAPPKRVAMCEVSKRHVTVAVVDRSDDCTLVLPHPRRQARKTKTHTLLKLER